MEENQYYMTTADSIYGMMRKSFIYVTKIRKKTFLYRFIDDWQFVETYPEKRKTSVTKLKVNKVEEGNYTGKLVDAPYFSKLHQDELILSPDCL